MANGGRGGTGGGFAAGGSRGGGGSGGGSRGTGGSGDGPRRRVVVVGASAGGVEALREFVAALPRDLLAPVLVVLHMAANAPSALPAILRRGTALPVDTATDGEPLQPGGVMVAAPDYHLTLRENRVRLSRGPQENGHRPAVDPLFRSAARWFGPQAIAVVLSGALDDGAAGAVAVHTRGGLVLVQDADEALYAGMPTAARAVVPTAEVGTAKELGRRVGELTGMGVRDVDPEPVSSRLAMETDMVEFHEPALQEPDRPGRPSGLACPDCHGVLFEIEEAAFVRFRCRVGHAWSPESLLIEQQHELEGALWVALRSLEERAALHRRLATSGRQAGRHTLAGHSEERAEEAARSASLIREMLLRQDQDEARAENEG